MSREIRTSLQARDLGGHRGRAAGLCGRAWVFVGGGPWCETWRVAESYCRAERVWD